MDRIIIYLQQGLTDLLYRRLGRENPLYYRLSRRASVKDVLESLGIPHPEISRLLVNGREAGFAAQAAAYDRIEVFGLAAPVAFRAPSALRPALAGPRFAVDANVGKLASLLRMAGLDTLYDPGLDDGQLAGRAVAEGRIVLTRDRALLMRGIIDHGHLIRECRPVRQLLEVVELYGLKDELAPLSRCLVCNTLLQPVAKDEISSRLQPLTRKYYQTFQICRSCDKIYWPGSHRERMQGVLEALERSLTR